MASVMAIGSEVFGSCFGEIVVSVGQNNVVVWLCNRLKYLGFILGVKSGSGLAEGVGDGARYWKPF